MIKKFHFNLIFFLTLTALNFAAISAQFDPLITQGRRNRVLEIAANNDKHFVSCKLNFLDSHFGKLDDATYYRTSFPLTLECLPGNDDLVNSGWAQYDPERNTWNVNFISNEDKKQRESFTKFSLLENHNSRGWMVTVADFTGEYKFREKKLYFCLVHLNKAVCGNGSVGFLKNGKKGDLTPYVTKIIRSIEFQ
ncbi:hypothetical protein WKW80_14040 [Variovorax humicola]|uniref:Uncharacterized protein n=1 Tax=Variovorax humicola TaxID=1769758 RepID=A0ABU8W0G6_9BURK